MKYLLRLIVGCIRYRIMCDKTSAVTGKLMKAFSAQVFDIATVKDVYVEFSCLSYYARRIIQYAKGEALDIQELGCTGSLYILRKFRERPGLVVGITAALLLCYLQTIPVWEIRITGNNTVSDSDIIETLDRVGFSVGSRKDNSKLIEYSNRFIIEEPRISRLSINISGNIAFVEVGERYVKKDQELPFSMTGLFADRDCIIELPVAESGTAMVKPGETVCEGQLLISPIIIGDNSKEYIVGASGRVMGRTREFFTVIVPYENAVKNDTDNSSGSSRFFFLGRKFDTGAFSPSYSKYYTSFKKSSVSFFDRLILPVLQEKKTLQEYTVSQKRISCDEAKRKAYEIMYSQLSDVLFDAEILTTKYTEADEGEHFTLKCEVECIKNVATPDF